jgi:hypothetical protein
MTGIDACASGERKPGIRGSSLERVTGIEPALSAWEADVLPLNYTRERRRPYLRAPVCGGPGASGDLLLATIRESIYRRSLPLATRDLRLSRSPLDDRAGMMGASFMVTDELFARDRLTEWIATGSPSRKPPESPATAGRDSA